jgi:hypothetical protein
MSSFPFPARGGGFLFARRPDYRLVSLRMTGDMT